MRHFLLLLGLAALAAAQAGITCNVEFTTTFMLTGGVRGNMKFTAGTPNAGNGRFLLTYPAQSPREQFSELYTYNSENGWNTDLLAPYSGQNIFRSGTSCACETGHADTAIPFLYTPSGPIKGKFNDYYVAGATSGGCTTYTINSALSSAQKKITMFFNRISFDSDGFPCTASKVESSFLTRTWKFSGCKTATFTSADFPIPSGCKCGKPIDIALVLDRSSSISRDEFKNQHAFVKDFVNQFEYDSILKANLAIINFKSNAAVHLPINSGVSRSQVDSAVSALGCTAACWDKAFSCGSAGTDCCCGRGTCIACGVRVGADELKNGRGHAFKLLITITDGFGNHNYSSDPDLRPRCGTTVQCDQAVELQMKYAKALLNPPVGREMLAMYAVGVGDDRELSMPQLILAAGNISQRVLKRTDFTDLARNSLELIGMACDAEENPCGVDCCGVCICGKCQRPDFCTNKDLCTPTGFSASSILPCCREQPITCDVNATANKCNTYQCNATTGQCVVIRRKTCEPSVDPVCFRRECLPADGNCYSYPTNASGCIGKSECVQTSDCPQPDGCTTVNCSGLCVSTSRNCTAELGSQVNKCVIVKCDRTRTYGCYVEPINASVECDDGNKCTTDTCDPERGCVNTRVVCPPDALNCTEETCDPLRGCLSVPVVCSKDGKVNTSRINSSEPLPSSGCDLYFCEESTGNCTTTFVACFDMNSLTLAAGIGAAALAGIIIAAVIAAVGCAGGSAYAYQQASNPDLGAGAINNPMYKSSGLSGENPLFKN